MAITYNKVKNEVATLLGAILGATSATAEANYVATMADGTLIGPDFTKTMIEDAVVAAEGEIVEAIASTPLHPERGRYESDTATLANNAVIPQADSGANVIIGVIGRVRDSVTSKTLLPINADAVRSFNEHSSIYSGFTPHWYAVVGDTILHTRTNVIIRVCTYTRPTSFIGNINLDDWHEGGLVQGAVAKLALKESMFQALYTGANAAWVAHLAEIRSYSDPAKYGLANAAPSST